jgi:serine/threonine-protein kinase RIM15
MEVRFKLHLESEGEREAPSYLPMEGKGMMMIDREEGHPSHTMWVIKPVSLPQPQTLPPSIPLEQGTVGDESSGLGKPFQLRSEADGPATPFPITRPINTSLILCRICECNIPQWYFEKHNETCSESHRLEAEIGDCNESVAELRNTIRELLSALDRSSPVATPEYRGMPIFTPSSSPGSSSPLQMFRAPLKMQKMGVKKLQRQLLEKLDDILLVAWEVSIPALKEDESKEPIERQRLLSPGSERKMSQVRNWSRPSIEDAALTQLVDDAERIMRQKLDNVIRLQNVIKYSEKTRHEWEEKVDELLASFVDEQDGGEESEDDEEEEEEEGEEEIGTGDATDLTSEYAFGAKSSGTLPSSEPTPIGSASPAPSLTRSDHRHGWTFHTRPSTPSSISSPLALAIPITASRAEDIPPHMDLNDSTPGVSRSPHNLEARQYIPPTLSPVILPVDIAAPTRRSHGRRLSTMAPIMSPSNSGQQPLSPRLPPVAPLSRTTPTSIKDFEIIKPISKGAFGSVFLARKKVTGDYFAIKVLKKADMIAKNQITNVKAERMILMQQAESPFVAKLYWTFQSKENLYLVMEYLNGGDCAALIKSLGSLPEVWTKNYIAEVVLGLEYLHDRGVVHRYAVLFVID